MILKATISKLLQRIYIVILKENEFKFYFLNN